SAASGPNPFHDIGMSPTPAAFAPAIPDRSPPLVTALSRQIGIGDFRRRIRPSALVIREQKQWTSSPPWCARRQYRIYSDNALASALALTANLRPTRTMAIDGLP